MKPDAPAPPPVQPVQAARSPALSNRELSTPPSPAAPSAPVAAPASRPKLNLAKRTVSEAPSDTAPSSGGDSKASPFGAAKPIDTATREKEVEEKRQIAIREKKEADEKARVEKKAAEDKAREEKKAARDAEIAARVEKDSSSKEKPNGQVPQKEKSNGQVSKEKEVSSAPPPGKNYEILRRAANDETSAADEEAEEAADADGIITEDKAIKPKEIVRDIPTKNEEAMKTNGATSASTNPSATALEDDGWSTVSKPSKNRKNGNQASRAIAS